MDRYSKMAKELGMLNAVLVSPADVFFDVRAIMKCRWGCVDHFQQSIKCSTRGTTFEERVEMVGRYKSILLLHCHDATELSAAVIEIEKRAFLDGYYFAFGIRYCMLCRKCAVERGKPCPTPQKVRPCDQAFGIDVYKTARNQNLPCDVLKGKNEEQNRYGFVLID